MEPKKSYKLGQYKIIESGNGGLGWEAHTGLGSAKGGPCFIRGNFLIIGPSETEEPGFLKREFLEHLDQLPAWEKTKYYCHSHAVYECKTARRMRLGLRTVKYEDKPENKTTVDDIGITENVREPVSDQRGRKQNVLIIKEKLADMWRALRR